MTPSFQDIKKQPLESDQDTLVVSKNQSKDCDSLVVAPQREKNKKMKKTYSPIISAKRNINNRQLKEG
jgi:hypothetical protein